MGISGRILWAAVLAAQVGMLAAAEAESGSQGDRTALRITVYVYNQAKVPAEKLEQAKQEAAMIYREAGTEVD